MLRSVSYVLRQEEQQNILVVHNKYILVHRAQSQQADALPGVPRTGVVLVGRLLHWIALGAIRVVATGQKPAQPGSHAELSC